MVSTPLLFQLWEVRDSQSWSAQNASRWHVVSRDLREGEKWQVCLFWNYLLQTSRGVHPIFLQTQDETSLTLSHLPRSIYKWWAQYLESQSDMDSALHFYNLAEDYFSLVRVYCYMEDIQKVTELRVIARFTWQIRCKYVEIMAALAFGP